MQISNPETMPEHRKPSPLPPYLLVRFIQQIRKALLHLHDHLFPASVVLYEKFQNLFLLPPLYVVSELDIAGHLVKGPKSVEELAALTRTDPDSLGRILRTLSSHGIFRELDNRTFALTPMAKPLLQGKGSLREVFIQHLGPENWQTLGNLMHTVRTGEDAFTHIHGVPIYDYLALHPEKYEIFDRSMAGLSDLGLAPMLQRYNFSGFHTVADIGGGDGALLKGILSKYPALKGILFDVEAALEKSKTGFTEDAMYERVRFVSGDFFHTIPAGADCYLLKNVIHNWNDEKALVILRNTAAAMAPGARLLILEMVLPDKNQASTATLIDLQMLATMPGGRERTVKEYEILLGKAGLKLRSLTHTIAPVSILEACR